MENLPVVDGGLMVQVVKRMKAPEIEVLDMSYIEAQIEDTRSLMSETRDAGFLAQSQKLENDIRKLHQEMRNSEKLKTIQEYRDRGYFVINVPEWDDDLVLTYPTGTVTVPYRFVSRRSWRRAIALHDDYQALYMVPIKNWCGDIPLSVMDACKEMAHEFLELAIMFVAKRSEVRDLIGNFVKQDPILVGRMNTDNLVVLKMWGDDLNDIDLALLEDE